jgi:nucleoside-diphosphate-sugar epimerase
MSPAPRRALVTGATGFIGSALAARLANLGWEVHATARPDSDLTRLGAHRPRMVVHRLEGRPGELGPILEEVRPETVFHLASLFLARHRPDQVRPLVESNILFPAELAEAMARSGANPRMVNAGTSWQHHLDREYDPVCLYAATKQAFEDLLAWYREGEGLRCATLKLFDTYGPGDTRPKLFHLLREASSRAEPLAMSPGEQRLDLVFIDDVVEAFLRCDLLLAQGVAPPPAGWTVSSGAPMPLREVVELYGRVTGRPVPVAWGALPYRPREVMAPWDRGTTVPGWTPRVGLEEGIRRMEGLVPELAPS